MITDCLQKLLAAVSKLETGNQVSNYAIVANLPKLQVKSFALRYFQVNNLIFFIEFED